MTALISLSVASWSEAQTPPSTWTFGLGFYETRQLDRTVNGEPTGDFVMDNANIQFGYATVRERSRVSFSVRAGTSFPREGIEERRNQNDFGLGFGWNQRVTEHFQSTLDLNVSRNFSRETLSDLGLIAPDLTADSAGASWTTQYQAGPSTSLSTSLSYQFIDIANVRTIPGAQIVVTEQPFRDTLSIPLMDDDGGPLPIRDAEQDILAILATEGLDGRANRSQDASAGFGLNHRVSERTSIGFQVSAGYRTFQQGLQSEGSQAMGRLFVQRSIGKASALNAAYDISRSIVLVPTTTIQSVFGGYSTSGQETALAITLSGGVSLYDAQDVTSQWTPVGNVSLSGALTSSTTAGVSYVRQYNQAIGFGRPTLIDFANANLTQELGSRATFSLNVGATFSTDPLDLQGDSSARLAGASLTFRILSGLSAGTSFFWTETEFERFSATTTTQNKTWSFYLNFGTTWH